MKKLILLNTFEFQALAKYFKFFLNDKFFFDITLFEIFFPIFYMCQFLS